MGDTEEGRMKIAILRAVVTVALSATVGILILAAWGREGSGALLMALLSFQTPILVALLAVFQALWKIEAKVDGQSKRMEQVARSEAVEAGIVIQKQEERGEK